MSNHAILNSIGIKSKRVIERCEHSKRKCIHTPMEQLGFNKSQCERIKVLQEEMKQFSTTC